jgi:diguanylate cyclase (GGDEF)-like protein/PAS domain S-box-containing protein
MLASIATKLRAISNTTVLYHGVISVAFLGLYLLLSRPEVILLSTLGFTAWYPAVGVVFALMVGLTPRYLPVIVLADVLASLIIYHQPIYSWSVIPSAFCGTAIYAVAAWLMHGKVKINRTLGHLSDVSGYLAVALTAGIFATLSGVSFLAADGSIRWNQFGESAVAWYMGDAVGLLSVAPFLLIYLFPWLRKKLSESTSEGDMSRAPTKAKSEIQFFGFLEVTGQALCMGVALWIMFGPSAPKQYFYLAFVPIIWIAMRGGIERAVVGLLALNFGIVVAVRVAPTTPEALTKIGLLMLVISATGLIVGSAVSERRWVAEELRERTLFLDSLVENSPFGIAIEDASGTAELCNDAFTRMYGYKRSEVVGQKLNRLIVSPNQMQESDELLSHVRAGRDVHRTLLRMRKDGSPIDVETHAIPLIRGGRFRGAYVIYNDVSLQVQASTAAAEHAQALNELVAELQLRTNEMTLLIEMGNLLQSSSTAEDVFGVVAKSAKQLFAGSRGGALFLFKSSRNVLELASSWGEGAQLEKIFVPSACWSLRRGQPHWSGSSATIRCEHLKGAGAGSYLCVPLVAQGDTLGILEVGYEVEKGGDIAGVEAKRAMEHRLGSVAASQIALSLASLRLRDSLRDQSIRDPLTGLFNRRFMEECLDRELLRAVRKNRALAIIFLDVDHFKRFNDTYGHDAGDEVLRAMGDFFRVHFRGDDVICRYGGEEFAIILPESTAQDAAVRAELLRTAAKNLRITHRGKNLEAVTVSAGIAGYPEHAGTADGLLQAADASLYEAKAKGRDRVVTAEVKRRRDGLELLS